MSWVFRDSDPEGGSGVDVCSWRLVCGLRALELRQIDQTRVVLGFGVNSFPLDVQSPTCTCISNHFECLNLLRLDRSAHFRYKANLTCNQAVYCDSSSYIHSLRLRTTAKSAARAII